MSPIPGSLQVYHVFLASPGDVDNERRQVRKFFDRYNQQTAQLWGARFEVVDWENYSTIGVGQPQQLITEQTLERFRDSLALVIGIMGQRFGTPGVEAESGTEEEFNWALKSHQAKGFPEIKWFFRRVDQLSLPPDPDVAAEALEQWKRVCAFRKRLKDPETPVFVAEFSGNTGFRDTLEGDLNRWLNHPERPWVQTRASEGSIAPSPLSPPTRYYENLERDFRRLDIAGIDNDRSFEIPLSEIYVRLRVMFDEDESDAQLDFDSGTIEIQTALLRYPKLVIVGDPGSGKSTFLKFIALMLSRSMLENDPNIALDKLCLPEPLPIPIFLSCWDFADFLKQKKTARLTALVEFIADRLNAFGFPVETEAVESLLQSGNCCLLFDGLDEVPTDAGRAAVSRLLEDCVDQYGSNRFVITSRIRAYTGDTILKGRFTRCDIQPFDPADRAEFIRNWTALLFQVTPDQVELPGTDPSREFLSLRSAIEDNDRIRPLAVNPLLLTVIAIVHWNRKRLPEQRVDLYDECVDVLLGQRKEAEHIQISRRVNLSEEREEAVLEKRAWVKKRFAEIALKILSQDGDQDEVTRTDIVELLVPRFIAQGAESHEQAVHRATLFLDRQELKSGLLVSRRAQSYRFVHLTFQEYLAAWQLSHMDFDDALKIIQSRLRMAKWFETLQLLGGQWAKESDENADRYLAWLLENQGDTTSEKAPIVALCSNIVRDIEGVAEIRPITRALYNDALRTTLDSFKEGSGVPVGTQFEILGAIGRLGAPAKSHIMDATRAGLLRVRKAAIELVLPYLSDDELFSMKHIAFDRSKEPIKVYLLALINRDPSRTSDWLLNRSNFSTKTSEAILELCDSFQEALSSDTFSIIFKRCKPSMEWIEHGEQYLSRLRKSESTWELLTTWLFDEQTRTKESTARAAAKALLAMWPNSRSREFLLPWQAKHSGSRLGLDLASYIFAGNPDGDTASLLLQELRSESSTLDRASSMKFVIGNGQLSHPEHERLLKKLICIDDDPKFRCFVLLGLLSLWRIKSGYIFKPNLDRVLANSLSISQRNLRSHVENQLVPRPIRLTPQRRSFLKELAVDENRRIRDLAISDLFRPQTFARYLLSRHINGRLPFIDIRQPILQGQIEVAWTRSGHFRYDRASAENEIKKLSSFFGWDLTKHYNSTTSNARSHPDHNS